jgi:hypothetical protein
MNVKLFRSHFRIQKKYIGFFTVVPLMILTAVIKVPDPVCGGTGYISNTGMSTVSVLQVDSSLVSSSQYDACLSYRLYTYNVVVTLQNSAKAVDANGYLLVALIDVKTGKVLGSEPVVAVVPAMQQVQNFFNVTFYLGSDPPGQTQVVAAVKTDAQVCQVCGGSGRVSLNALLLAQFQKTAYTKVQLVQAVDITQPETSLSPEELMGMEGNTDQWYLEHPPGSTDNPDSTDTSTP